MFIAIANAFKKQIAGGMRALSWHWVPKWRRRWSNLLQWNLYVLVPIVFTLCKYSIGKETIMYLCKLSLQSKKPSSSFGFCCCPPAQSVPQVMKPKNDKLWNLLAILYTVWLDCMFGHKCCWDSEFILASSWRMILPHNFQSQHLSSLTFAKWQNMQYHAKLQKHAKLLFMAFNQSRLWLPWIREQEKWYHTTIGKTFLQSCSTKIRRQDTSSWACAIWSIIWSLVLEFWWHWTQWKCFTSLQDFCFSK